MQHSEATKKKISEKLLGRQAWNKGRFLLERKNCLLCGKVCSRGSEGFCSIRHHRDYQQNLLIEKWKNGEAIGKKAIKRYLLKVSEGRCSICNLNEWMGKKLVVELEHKDGNSENNSPENVCLLCPNCHSQTATYKSKNRGNGRHSRRIRYHEGKSF